MLEKQIKKKVNGKSFGKKHKVYLAGPMEFVKDFGVNWRKDIEPVLTKQGFMVFNPCNEVKLFQELKNLGKKRDQGNLKKFSVVKIKNSFSDIQSGKGAGIKKLQYQFGEIIREDLKEVISSDVILCNWIDETFSAGTSGELTIAKLFNIPVLIISKDIKKLPKWILGCVTKHQKSFREVGKSLMSIIQQEVIYEKENN